MTDTTETTPTTDLADAYIAMWNEEDPATRAALIEEAWAADGAYRDPLLAADGHAALSEMVEPCTSTTPASASPGRPPSTSTTASPASAGSWAT